MKFIYMVCYLTLTTLLLAEKVDVISDNMHTNALKKEIHFVGHAKVTKAEDWIHADTIIVFFNENNETKKYKAIGNVDFEFKNEEGHYRGNSDIIEFFPLKSKYILTGKSHVNDLMNKRTVKGEKIIIDMLTGDSIVQGSKNKPVKFTFEMEEKK